MPTTRSEKSASDIPGNKTPSLLLYVLCNIINSGIQQTVDLRKLETPLPALVATVCTWSWKRNFVSTKTPRSLPETEEGFKWLVM